MLWHGCKVLFRIIHFPLFIKHLFPTLVFHFLLDLFSSLRFLLNSCDQGAWSFSLQKSSIRFTFLVSLYCPTPCRLENCAREKTYKFANIFSYKLTVLKLTLSGWTGMMHIITIGHCWKSIARGVTDMKFCINPLKMCFPIKWSSFIIFL